jgi:hypothetical protein
LSTDSNSALPRLETKTTASSQGTFFLSHASGDRRFANELAKALRRHGVAVWYSRTHLREAQQWQEEIGFALRRCDWFAVVLSPRAVKSMWVKRELSDALIQKRFQDKIVPILHRNCDYEKLHWTLAGFQMVDFTSNFATGCADLLRIWALQYKQ